MIRDNRWNFFSWLEANFCEYCVGFRTLVPGGPGVLGVDVTSGKRENGLGVKIEFRAGGRLQSERLRAMMKLFQYIHSFCNLSFPCQIIDRYKFGSYDSRNRGVCSYEYSRNEAEIYGFGVVRHNRKGPFLSFAFFLSVIRLLTDERSCLIPPRLNAASKYCLN